MLPSPRIRPLTSRGGGGQPLFGDLNVAVGKTLTTTGGGVRFDNTPLPAGAITITANATTNLGRVSDGANTSTLNKAGTGTLVLNDVTNDLDGTTINVSAGILQATNDAAGADSLGTALVQLTGGGQLLLNTVSQHSSATLVGSYTGTFYELATQATPVLGTNALLGTAMNTLTAYETVSTGITEINFASSAGNPFASATTDDANFNVDDHTARFTGQINVPTAGDIRFFTSSDDGSVLWVDLNNDGDFVDAGEEVVDNRGDHGMQVRVGTRNLAPGTTTSRSRCTSGRAALD